MHVERLLQLGEHVVGGRVREVFEIRPHLPRARAQAIDAKTPRELSDPGSNGVVVAERVEPLVDPREYVLEDILRVVGSEPETLDGDGVDVAGEALDELPPSLVVAFTAAGDEGGVGQLGGQRCAARSRLAIVSMSFQAIEAFDSTSGRNSHEVRP